MNCLKLTIYPSQRHLVQNTVCRTFVTTFSVSGRKNLARVKWLKMDEHPYDERFHVSPREVAKTFKRPKGSNELAMKLAVTSQFSPKLPGFLVGKTFHYIPEMQPEFIVPDLTDFKLKPYVSYKVPEVVQKEFTSKDLFSAVYAADVVEDYKDGRLKIQHLSAELVLEKTK